MVLDSGARWCGDFDTSSLITSISAGLAGKRRGFPRISRRGAPVSSRRHRQTHCPSGAALQSAVDDSCVEQEVQARVRIAHEEFVREQVALSAVAGPARRYDIARRVRTAASERLHVIQSRRIQIQRRAAVDTPAAAVP